MGQKPRFWPSS